MRDSAAATATVPVLVFTVDAAVPVPVAAAAATVPVLVFTSASASAVPVLVSTIAIANCTARV